MWDPQTRIGCGQAWAASVMAKLARVWMQVYLQVLTRWLSLEVWRSRMVLTHCNLPLLRSTLRLRTLC
jgi:hypothetical protein